MKTVVVIAALAAIGVIGAAPSHADDGANNYIAFLQSHGVSFPSRDAALQQGIQVCEHLQSGESQTQVIGDLEQRMGSAEASDYVVAATQSLC